MSDWQPNPSNPFSSGLVADVATQNLVAPGYDPEHRRAYRGRPADYMREVLGVPFLTDDQLDLLKKMERNRRVLAQSGNNLGKTHLMSAYGVYWMDVIGATLDDNGEPEGGLWILSHPTAAGIFGLLWSAALKHIRNAARLGYMMPGFISDRSVTWYVREDWRIEGISPPKRAGELQQHGGAGRHHKNLLVTFDEAPGIELERYRAAEGMASGLTNKFFKIGNPTENFGPFYDYATNKSNERIHVLSAFSHPNVIKREEIIDGAISHVDIDTTIRDWCEDRGPYPEIQPDPAYDDFVYALHPDVGTEAQEHIPDPLPYSGTGSGKVKDETSTYPVGTIRKPILGHAHGNVHVFRPDHRFRSSRMGLFPLESVHGLFHHNAILECIAAWEATARSGITRDLGPPDRVGVDPAEDGGDLPMSAPRWDFQAPWGQDIIRIGRLVELSRGLGDDLANQLAMKFGKKPLYVVDVIGVGAGTESHLRATHSCKTERFKSSYTTSSYERKEDDPPYVLDEPAFGNVRAAAYWRAAQLVNRRMVQIPPDDLLKAELINAKYVTRKGKMYILPKKDIKVELGRSPDRADAFVMALYEELVRAEAGGFYMPRYTPLGSEIPQDFSFWEARQPGVARG